MFDSFVCIKRIIIVKLLIDLGVNAHKVIKSLDRG